MKRLLLLTAILLSGCETVKQNIEDYQNAPKYRQEFRPIQGILNSASLYQANLVCSSEAQMYSEQQDYRAEQNYIAGSSTSYDCKAKSRYGYSDTIEAKCKPNTGIYTPSREYRILQNSAAYAGNSVKQNAFKTKMTSCMAQRGYSLQRVCYKNCYQTDSRPSSQSKPKSAPKPRDLQTKVIYCVEDKTEKLIAHERDECPVGSTQQPKSQRKSRGFGGPN